MKYFDVSMKSSSDSFDRSEMFTRRTATVIISAPDASCAFTITAFEEYLPVPTISRDVNVLSAMRKLSMSLTAADEVDDLDRVACADRSLREQVALQHDEIVLDRNPPRVDVELLEQLTDGYRRCHLEGVAVEADGHFQPILPRRLPRVAQ